jgi:hypothetical protein
MHGHGETSSRQDQRQVLRQLMSEDETALPAPDVAEFTILLQPGPASDRVVSLLLLYFSEFVTMIVCMFFLLLRF